MFQLHLPRYSSRNILKQRLLCAIQDGGSRSDNSATKRMRLTGDDSLGTPIAKPRLIPPTLVIDVSADGGHLEDLRSFCVRAGVGFGPLKDTLGVPDM